MVTAGSSNLRAELTEQIKKLMPKLVDKLTGRQLTIVVLGIALLLGGDYAWKAWLEQRRVVRIEELKTQEHVDALKALQFANAQQAETFRQILATLQLQGTIGQRVSDAAVASYEALLRAAARTPVCTINDQHLNHIQADTLCVSPKPRSIIRVVQQQMRVIDINTGDPQNLQFILLDEESGDQHRLKLVDSLFASRDRQSLFRSPAVTRTHLG